MYNELPMLEEKICNQVIDTTTKFDYTEIEEYPMFWLQTIGKDLKEQIK